MKEKMMEKFVTVHKSKKHYMTSSQMVSPIFQTEIDLTRYLLKQKINLNDYDFVSYGNEQLNAIHWIKKKKNENIT